VVALKNCINNMHPRNNYVSCLLIININYLII